MNCKLIFFFALVLCFGQGQAQWGWLNKAKEWGNDVKNKAEQVGNGIVDKVSSTAKDAQQAIKNAKDDLENKIDNARKNVEESVKNTYENARAEIEGSTNKLIDEISSLKGDVVSTMSPQAILDEASKLSEKIDALIIDVTSQMDGAVETAKNAAKNRVGSWDIVIQQASSKAKALGVDVAECSVDRVRDMGESALNNAVSCLTNKFEEAKNLVLSFIEIGQEGHALVDDIRASYDLCSLKSGVDVVVCAASEMLPLFQRILTLANDAVISSKKAVLLVQTLKLDLTTCMAGVAVQETSKVPALTIEITKCIATKISQKTGAPAA